MSALQIMHQAIEQEQNNQANNQKLLEQILDKVIILEANIKIKNEFLVGYYDMRELEKIIGLTSVTLYKKIAANEFPKQVNLGVKAVGWCKKEIHAWIEINTQKGLEYISEKGWTNIYTERYQK